jgi:hypothetical protein
MSRTLLLARTFFGRLFESDLMPPGLPQAQLVIWSMAFLATPGLLLPVRFAAVFLGAPRNPRAVDVLPLLLLHRLLFITLSMTAIGLVALVIWDGMFPDRRDARILGGLPVPGRTIIAGRLLALAALCGIFVLGINAVPTVLNGPLLPMVDGASNSFRGAAAHFLATSMSGIFVFSTLLMLQGIVLNIGGRKAADRLSLVLQVVFIAALLQMIFFMPRMVAVVRSDLGAGWIRALPSLWFVGLYDVIAGRPRPASGPLAAMALAATLGTVSAAVGLFTFTHARLMRRAIESAESPRHNKIAVALVRLVTRGLCWHPVARATFEFTLKTIARSRSHRLLMAMYVGLAIAIVASAVVPLMIGRGFAAFLEPDIEVLSAPLVIAFFTLIGARVALAIPVEPKATWVFKLAEPANRGAAMDGVRAALVVTGVLPTTVVAAASVGLLWGPRAAAIHALVCFLMGWALVEILLIRMFKIPFTCTYFPGRSRFTKLWPLYLTAFTTYCFTTAKLVKTVFLEARTWEPLAYFVLLTTISIALLTWTRRRSLRSEAGFKFEEDPLDEMFAGFNLSEGFAAGTKESRQLR